MTVDALFDVPAANPAHPAKYTAALLFLAMFAGLFGAFGSTAPERQCWSCGRVGGLVGVTLPPLRSKLSNHAPLI